MANLYNTIYNPDVLSCLANLSNDEVFTPPDVANAMLDMLPQELFENPDVTFLDPASKSGVFLREIAKRLLEGLEPIYPDLQERADHIFKKQLFGIAITELTANLSRRSVYCSKFANGKYSVCSFDTIDGNVRYKRVPHTWEDGRCVFCGASQSEYDRADDLETHAYEFIHTIKPEEIFDMKFDVIVSNPPYQMSDAGTTGGAMPIYQYFIGQAKKLNPKYICMIIPARWYAGGRGLNKFRAEMLNDDSIRAIVDYPKSRDCFQGVDIAGGVCYFLRENGYHGDCEFTSVINDVSNTKIRKMNEFDIFIRNNLGIDIIHKILKLNEPKMDKMVLNSSPFGFRSFARGKEQPFKDCVTLISSAGESFIERTEIKRGLEFVDKYKVCIGKLNPDRAGVNNAADGKSNVTTKVALYGPNTVNTETYVVVGCFGSKMEAENLRSYIQTKFARFLMFMTMSSLDITKTNFQFVPVQDFSKPWTDKELYEKYGLTDEEIDFIESLIKPMETGGDD